MKKTVVVLAAVVLATLGLWSCGGGGSGGGSAVGEAVIVTLSTTTTPSLAPASVIARPAAVTGTLYARAENVGTITVRGLIFTHYDGGAGFTPGEHDLYVCQKAFPLKADNKVIGAANYLFHRYEEEDPGLYPSCQPGVINPVPGDGYCDVPGENPELDCDNPLWRTITIRIFGFAGGGGFLRPGESTGYGGGYSYPPGTYQPSAAVYRWDGTMYDNDVKTLTVQ